MKTYFFLTELELLDCTFLVVLLSTPLLTFTGATPVKEGLVEDWTFFLSSKINHPFRNNLIFIIRIS